MHLLTDALISEVATVRGAWTRAQLEVLGVPWPPPKGWRKRLVSEGRVLSGVEFAELRDLRTVTAKKGNGVAAPENSDVPTVTSCPWCGAPVVRIQRGGYVKEFCSKAHKTDYKNALSKLSIIYARMLRTPGALQAWSLRGGTPWPSANSVPEAPKGRK